MNEEKEVEQCQETTGEETPKKKGRTKKEEE